MIFENHYLSIRFSPSTSLLFIPSHIDVLHHLVLFNHLNPKHEAPSEARSNLIKDVSDLVKTNQFLKLSSRIGIFVHIFLSNRYQSKALKTDQTEQV
jgi:hypothetical protein